MGILISMIVFLGGLKLMSGGSKLLFISSILLTVGYGLMHSDHYGDAFREPASIEHFINFIYLTVGTFLLGIYLGIVRRVSDSPDNYKARRNATFKFLGFWSGLYALYSLGTTSILNQITDDHFFAFMLVKRYGGLVFVTLLILYFLGRRASRVNRSLAATTETKT